MIDKLQVYGTLYGNVSLYCTLQNVLHYTALHCICGGFDFFTNF